MFLCIAKQPELQHSSAVHPRCRLSSGTSSGGGVNETGEKDQGLVTLSASREGNGYKYQRIAIENYTCKMKELDKLLLSRPFTFQGSSCK